MGSLPHSCCFQKNALRNRCVIPSRPGRHFRVNSLPIIDDLSGFVPERHSHREKASLLTESGPEKNSSWLADLLVLQAQEISQLRRLLLERNAL